MKKTVTIIIIIVFCALMLMSIGSNKFDVITNDESFNNFQLDSESLVIGELAKARVESFDVGQLFLGSYQFDSNDWIEKANHQIEAFNNYNDYQPVHFDRRFQQIGLQGIVLVYIDKITHYTMTIQDFHWINAVLLAAVLAAILIWIKKEFGWLTFIFVAIFTFYNHWLVIMGKNLYWCLWLMLLPFAAMLVYFMGADKHKKVKTLPLFIIGFTTVFLRFTCGYEFVSTILISLTLPYIYYALKWKTPIKEFLNNFSIISIGGLLGFFGCIFVHVLMRQGEVGGVSNIIENLLFDIGKRTVLVNVDLSNANPAFLESLNVSTLSVVKDYINQGDWLITFPPSLKIPVIFSFHTMKAFLAFFGAAAIGYWVVRLIFKQKDEKSNNFALMVMTLVSLLGPLSWFVLAKGHAYIHEFIDYILWSVPCVFLLSAYMGYSFKEVMVYFGHGLKRVFLLIKQRLNKNALE